jgi:hypothetical protein
MNRRIHTWVLLGVLVLLSGVLAACRGARARAAADPEAAAMTGQVLYTRTGMHAAADKKGNWSIKSTNYVATPKLVRAGAALTVQSIGRDRMEVLEADGTPLDIRFEAKHSMMSFDAWRDRQFSSTPIELPKDLSKLERKCIEEGRAEVGMSRDALFVAIGYPPANRSPDLQAGSLTYATDMWGTRRYEFDDKGKLTAIVE